MVLRGFPFARAAAVAAFGVSASQYVGVASAHAQTEPASPVQVVGSATATAKVDQLVSVFVLVNQGRPQKLNALAAEPSSITLSFDRDPPACPAKPETVATGDAVGTGAVSRLHVRACGEMKGATQTISVWGAFGGTLTTVKVQLGEAETKPVVAALETVELNVEAGAKTASGVFCLPGTADGTVGFVRRDTTIGTVVVSRPPNPEGTAASCPAPTTQAGLSTSIDGRPGTYLGKIDSNGPAEGGILAVTVNSRRQPPAFWICLLFGMAMATGIGWWSRFGRDWGFVDQTAADVRAAVWSGQEALQSKLAEAYGSGRHQRWLVVSSSSPRDPVLAIDKELAEYLSSVTGLRRFVEAPSADRLATGARVTVLRTAAKTYLDTIDTAVVLAEWRKSATKTSSPTVIAVDQALCGSALPASGAIAGLKTEADAAFALVKRFNGLANEIRGIEADARRLSKPEVATDAAALLETLWLTTLDDAGVATLRTPLSTLRERLRSAAPASEFATRDALNWLAGAANLDELLGTPGVGQHYGALVDLSPREQAAVIRRRNFGTELVVAAVGLLIASLSAYAALYAPNLAWGTEKDLLAAVTWSATAGGAIQVARHFTSRLTA